VEHPGMLDPAVKKPYGEMTMEEIRGFHDTVRSLETIARSRKEVTIDGKRRQLNEVVSELIDKLSETKRKFTLEELQNPARLGVDPLWRVSLDRMSATLRAAEAEFKPQQYKSNQFDRHEVLGPFAKAIFERVFQANYRKVDLMREASKAFREGARELGKDWQKSLNQYVTNRILVDDPLSERAGKPIYRKLTRGDMLGIARHVGNESNFDKLTKGMGWRGEDVWRFLFENMTDKDWRATQMVWDVFDRHWPEMAEMNRRLGSAMPERVEPRAFKTPSGIEMRGGYAPIDYDPQRSRLAVKKADAAAINPDEGLFDRSYFRADTTTNGSLNSRVANYYDFVDLGYHSLERRLHDTLHDLAYREALIDVHKILSDKDFRREFQLAYGPEQYKSLQRWVGDIANGQNRDAAMTLLEKVGQKARNAMVANGIAYRLSTVVKHGGSALLKSLSYFSGGGEKYAAARFTQVIFNHREAMTSAIEKFPEIRARALQQDRDFREMSASLFEPESALAKNKRFGHAFVAYLDLMSAVPTAWAAYDRAILEGIPRNRGGTGQPMSEADAIAYANQIVREAHGSNIESARSMVMNEKNEFVKMSTTLYQFMNNSLGQMLDAYSKLRTAGYSKPEVMARYVGTMVMSAILIGLIRGKKDDDSWANWFVMSNLEEMAGMLPLARDIYSAAEGYPSAGKTPLGQNISAVGRAGNDVAKLAQGEPVKHPIKDLGNAAGLLIPGLGQLGGSAQYAADWAQGKERPESAGDVARGLAFGQGKR